MKFSIVKMFLAALMAVPAMASKVVEDSRNRFVLEDEVLTSTVFGCKSSAGGMFIPENASYEEGNRVPFRVYRIAVPSNAAPSVQVQDVKTVPLGMDLCIDEEDGLGEEFRFASVTASAPRLRDGLWISDVKVPLYIRSGKGALLRKNFKLKVDFSGAASGVNPGKRALGRVENPSGASRFGLQLSSQRKALRKAATDETANVNFLAQFQVGDKNLGSFSEDGMYAVDFKTIRSAMLSTQREGELDGIPIERLCLYGASPDTLADRGPGEALRNPNQIFEVPIEVRDHSPNGNGADGIFNDGDTLLFVGYGNAFWKRCDREDSSFVNGKMDYFHSYSPYSFYQKFLFGWKDSGKGLRFGDGVKSVAGTGKDVTWMRYVRAEKDAILRDSYFGRVLDWEATTGKEWFWQWHGRFDTTYVRPPVMNSKETSDLPGFVEGGKSFVALSYFPHRSVYSSTALVSKDQPSNTLLSGKSYEERMNAHRFLIDINGVQTIFEGSTLIPGGNFRIDSTGLKKSDNDYFLVMLPNDRQYDRFDGYSVAYQWTPVVDSAEWMLPGAVSGVIRIPAASDVQLMKFKNLQPVGMLPVADGFAKDSVGIEDDVRYLAVKKNVYRTGLKVEGIPHKMDRVLKDLTRPNSQLEYLIISPYEFLDGSLSLAEFRSNGSAVASYATSVVDVNDIYRRYTAGRVSPVAIRNYIAYVASVCPNLRYVLLVGSGHYDYRGFNSRLGEIYIPPFEKEDGVYDDFYGILDSGEVVQYGTYDLDLAVGRLPVSSATELANYIQKAKDYEKLGSMDYSDWRSTLLLTADDALNGFSEDDTPHTKFQEELASSVDSLSKLQRRRWNIKKIYLIDYESDAAGQKKAAADDFLNILNQGALFSSYFGHGSKTDWASEGLLKPSYLSKLSNKGRYTILGSFSCTVGRYDEGNSRSLSEEFLLAPNVGSIVSIGASRETFATYNVAFAKSFFKNVLIQGDLAVGDAILKAKRISSGEYSRQRYNDERYAIIGEPVVRVPSEKLKISLDQKLDTLKILDKVKLSGSVDGIDDGFIDLSLREGRFSKAINIQVDSMIVDVAYDGALIYSEEVPVKNGRFETEFVTPRKMSIGDTAAEFRAWAYASNNPSVGRMWQDGLVISGVSAYADSLKDSIPPSIEIKSCYAGGTTAPYADGQSVKLQSPACLQIEVSDSTALDYREQADEGISFEIIGLRDPFHPWPYLEQTSKRAKMRMNFTSEQYPAGSYTFKVRAQDVLGNMATKLLKIDITEDMEEGLADVFNVPNPMGKNGTTFFFKNLAVDRESHVNIFIYNQNGKLVKVIKDAVSGVTRWNGRDEQGRPLANGLYHYVVRSEVPAAGGFGKKTWTKKQKLLISR